MSRKIVDKVKDGDPSGEEGGSTSSNLGSNLSLKISAFAIFEPVNDKLDQIGGRLEVGVLQILETLIQNRSDKSSGKGLVKTALLKTVK